MTSTSPRIVIIARESDAGAAALGALAAKLGASEIRWLAPRDVDELDRVAASDKLVVLFPTQADFLSALWEGRVSAETWSRVSVRFASPAAVPDAELARATIDAWRAWSIRQRRRRVVAGTILSLIALAAAATLVAVL